MYQYILFDLDGTLVDSGLGVTNSVAYALRKWGKEVPDRAKLNRFIGPPLTWSFQNYHGYSEEDSLKAVADYREYYQDKGIYEAEVYPGIRELLADLKALGKTLLVATSKPEDFAVRVLKYLQLDSFFDFVAAATMDEKTRTAKADVIRYGLEQCGVADWKQAVIVGDRKHDILGAREAGIDSIGVLFGYGSREELEAAGATWICPGTEDVLKVIKEETV